MTSVVGGMGSMTLILFAIYFIMKVHFSIFHGYTSADFRFLAGTAVLNSGYLWD